MLIKINKICVFTLVFMLLTANVLAASTNTGNTLPLTQPNMSNTKIQTWTTNAALDIRNYSYINYKEQLKKKFSIFYIPRMERIL